MTKRIDPEIKAIRTMGNALDALPKDAQYRALAYIVSRAANVGRCSASEWLYTLAQHEREMADQTGGVER